MFSNSKIKNLKNQIDSQSSNTQMQIPDNTPSIDILVKIISSSFDEAGKIYKYEWSGVKCAVNGDLVFDESVGKSGYDSRAVCVEELGKDMTGKSSTVKNGEIVKLSRDINGFYFSTGFSNNLTDILDLRSEENLNTAWDRGIESNNPVNSDKSPKLDIIVRNVNYDPSVGEVFSYYKRTLLFTNDGRLVSISPAQKTEWAETTLHK